MAETSESFEGVTDSRHISPGANVGSEKEKVSGGRNQRFSRNGGQGWNERDEIGDLSPNAKGFGKV